MKKHKPDPIAQEAFEEKEKKRIQEDKLYEEERLRNLNAMTPEQRKERREKINKDMLNTIKGF